MKQIWKKVWNITIPDKLLAAIMLLVLCMVLLPIVRIMLYCVPWYDDFNYGLHVKAALDGGGSFGDVLLAAVQSAHSSYYAWQGTFSSCFMMSMMPAAWGSDKYVFGLWFILLTFLAGIFALVSVLLRDVLKADRWTTLAVQALIAITCIFLFRSPIEGLFWYNAGVHYTAMHGFGLLLTAMLIKLVYTQNRLLKMILLVISVPMALFVGGANYVTVLQISLVIISILGWGAIFKKKAVLWTLPAGFAMAWAVYRNVTAPGNSRRMVSFTEMSTGPMEAILNSFKSAFTYFDDFTGWMTLAIVIMIMPLAINIVSKTEFEFRYPGLVLLWSFCLYATGFTPTLYTMGHTLLSRATNMAKVTFQLLLFINLFYLLGWLCRYIKRQKNKEVKVKNRLCFYFVMAMVMLGIFAEEPNKGGEYAGYVAYYFVHTGEAYNYHQEYLRRVEICEGEETDVIVRPYVFKPWAMCLGDLSADADYEPNRFMASYFGKNSITCLTEEEEQALKE